VKNRTVGDQSRHQARSAFAVISPVLIVCLVALRAMASRFRSGTVTPDDPTASGELADARAWYQSELAQGTARFFEPRRSDCPWCGRSRIARHVVSGDIRQGKPGTFVLDRCSDCAHVFQNPRLTPEGLEFYYRDAYDGLNSERTDEKYSALVSLYQPRSAMVRAHRSDTPRRWLDIGTSNGHFCQTAQEVFPDTTFDGLDISAGVLDAERRGWIENAYHGMLLDHRDALKSRYDQISMLHYLEHTREPLAELDAVADALTDDGWLLIEVPDPSTVVARLLGSFWAGWMQPEHQHMMPPDNLCAALRERGFTIVAVERREAHMPYEAFFAVMILLKRLAPDPNAPWASPRWPRLARLWRLVATACAAPFLALSIAVDRIVIPKLLRSSHAYRVLARRSA
jgi:SAM-dependent methyltransferase